MRQFNIDNNKIENLITEQIQYIEQNKSYK
jgi:hypothetical protein